MQNGFSIPGAKLFWHPLKISLLTDVTQACPRIEIRVFGKANVRLRGQKMRSIAGSGVYAGGGFIGVTVALLQTRNSFRGQTVRNISD
jgi:hypothetical protein